MGRLDERYAVAWMPPQHTLLAELGRRWTGRELPGFQLVRDAATPDFLPTDAVPATQRAQFLMPITALRLPAASCGVGSLDQAVGDVAGRLTSFKLPPLEVMSRQGALVLAPTAPCPDHTLLLDALDTRIARCCAAHAALLRLFPTAYPPEIPLTRALSPGLADALLPRLSELLAPFLREPVQIRSLALVAAAHWRSDITVIEHYPLMGERRRPLPENFSASGPDLYSDFGDSLIAPPEDFFED
ncbi:MAG: hypothetical protein AAF371_04510 [Pseudomonadota bacterium]